VRTVSGYSVPGEGRSTLISVVTVAALFALWWGWRAVRRLNAAEVA